MKIPYEIMKETVKKAFLNLGLSEEQAEICAEVHTSSSADGVESHGMNRIPRFAEYVKKGWIDPNGTPELIHKKNAVENYDGHLGIGVINAIFASDRAVELAKEHGIGCVSIKNTTHWMRGDTYSWRMAEKGFLGISWINTESCMPLWGSDEQGVGNNPFCIAVPREEGPYVIDMAMSQYAYGKLETYRLAGRQLPYPGGYDKDGNLTKDPGAIEESRRILPTGYWKGSGLSLALDLAATLISNGNSGTDMDRAGLGSCTGCSQIFLAYDPDIFGEQAEIMKKLDRRVEDARNTHPADPARPVSCPGDNTRTRREKSMKEGIHVDERIWKKILELAE